MEYSEKRWSNRMCLVVSGSGVGFGRHLSKAASQHGDSGSGSGVFFLKRFLGCANSRRRVGRSKTSRPAPFSNFFSLSMENTSVLPHSHVQDALTHTSHFDSTPFHRKLRSTKHRYLTRRTLARSPFSAHFNMNGKHTWTNRRKFARISTLSTEYIQQEHTRNHVDQK